MLVKNIHGGESPVPYRCSGGPLFLRILKLTKGQTQMVGVLDYWIYGIQAAFWESPT